MLPLTVANHREFSQVPVNVKFRQKDANNLNKNTQILQN